MLLKTKILKCISKNSIAILLLLGAQTLMVAQQVIAVDSTGVARENPSQEIASQKKQNDSVLPFKRYKAEGVSAVIGGYVVLDSDIDKSYLEFKQNGVSVEEITRCELLGKLMEDKLYLHQAKQDSISISDAEINPQVDQLVQYMVGHRSPTLPVPLFLPTVPRLLMEHLMFPVTPPLPPTLPSNPIPHFRNNSTFP